jgi:hypothetical protein
LLHRQLGGFFAPQNLRPTWLPTAR